MAESKKTGAKGSKAAAPKLDLIEATAVAAEATETAVETKPALPPEFTQALNAQPLASGALFSSVREQGDAIRKAMSDAVTVSAKGALELNEKIIDAMTAQQHAAIDLWRSVLAAPDFPHALRTQSTASREAYEIASAQWKDVAESTARWMTKSFEPIRSAMQR